MGERITAYESCVWTSFSDARASVACALEEAMLALARSERWADSALRTVPTFDSHGRRNLATAVRERADALDIDGHDIAVAEPVGGLLVDQHA